MFSKLIFNSSWHELLLCVLIALGFASILYFRNKKTIDVPSRIINIKAGLRFFSSFFLLFLLLNIFLKRTINETQKPIILFAIDNSSSMIGFKDSLSLRKTLNRQIEAIQKSISENFELRKIYFGANTTTSKGEANFREKETNIEGLFSDLENNYSNENVGALILLSDGIYNKGTNPLNNTNEIPFPVYTIGTGDTTEQTDLLIQKISHNEFAYLGNIFPVQVSVAAKKLSGKEIVAGIYEGKQKKAEQTFKINSDNFFTSLNFTLSAEKGGVHRYTVNLTDLNEDANPANNARSFVIDVIDERSKILIIASSPHPDISALKESLDNNPAFETTIQMAGEKSPALKAYSLVIIHGYNSAQTQIMKDCLAANIPYWIVNPQTADNIPGIRINASNNRYNDAEPVLSKTFGLFTLSSELSGMIEDFPAVKTFFGNYSVNSGANNLITQKIGVVETENPILSFNESNGQKSAVFLGDGLWKWKMRNYSEKKNLNAFNELINKSVQYLSIKSDKSFFRVNAPKTVNENEQIEFFAEVYNKTYELINDPDITITITSSDKKQFNYTFSKTTNSYKLNIGFLSPGEYSWQAKVKSGNDLLVKSGPLLVKEIVAESINTVADHRLLFQLARRTGGEFYQIENSDQVANDLVKNEMIKPVTFTSNNTIPLIEYKWFFIMLIIFLGAEWWLRKRYSTI